MDFKVKSSDFVTPPVDAYFFDLIFIEEAVGKDNNPMLRWHWLMADIPAQQGKDVKGGRASTLTGIVPTLNNRFGKILKALSGGLELGATGSTDDLILGKFRVKAPIKHKPGKDGAVFCNIEELFEGQVWKGEGVGSDGVWDSLKDVVNPWRQKHGLAILPKQEQSNSGQAPAQNQAPSGSTPKKKDVPWAIIGPLVMGLELIRMIC